MSREVRRVPLDWQHPKDEKGRYIPMHDRFPYEGEDIERGLREGWLNKYMPNYGIECMPVFPEGSATGLQMYETCSEGTPISPVMLTEEELARWLVDNKASAFGDMTASYEGWLGTIRCGSSVGMAFGAGGFTSGVDLNADHGQ